MNHSPRHDRPDPDQTPSAPKRAAKGCSPGAFRLVVVLGAVALTLGMTAPLPGAGGAGEVPAGPKAERPGAAGAEKAGDEVRRLEGQREVVWSLAFSPDGRLVLGGGGGELK